MEIVEHDDSTTNSVIPANLQPIFDVISLGGASQDNPTVEWAQSRLDLRFLIQDSKERVDAFNASSKNVTAEEHDDQSRQTRRSQLFVIASQSILHTYNDNQLSLTLLRTRRASIMGKTSLILIHNDKGCSGQTRTLKALQDLVGGADWVISSQSTVSEGVTMLTAETADEGNNA